MNAVALHARASADFDAKLAHSTALLCSSATDHAGRIVQATSLGAEDMVLTDMIAHHGLPIGVATLDTGKLHVQTLSLMSRIEARYGVKVQAYRPQRIAAVEFVQRHGDRAMYRSVELRKACCALRKLEPLGRMLEGKTAWVTGLRREQSDQRADVPYAVNDGNGRIKINPLADWSWGDVWHYIATRDVPYNSLHDEFYPSIGCAPCTRAITLGEDLRAGRWWWENEAAKECGLHLSPHSTGASAPPDARSAAGSFVSAQADFGAVEVKDAPASGRSQNDSAKQCGLHLNNKQANTGASA